MQKYLFFVIRFHFCNIRVLNDFFVTSFGKFFGWLLLHLLQQV